MIPSIEDRPGIGDLGINDLFTHGRGCHHGDRVLITASAIESRGG